MISYKYSPNIYCTLSPFRTFPDISSLTWRGGERAQVLGEEHHTAVDGDGGAAAARWEVGLGEGAGVEDILLRRWGDIKYLFKDHDIYC